MKHLFLALSIMAVALTAGTCNEPNQPQPIIPRVPSIALQTEFITCTVVGLKLTTTESSRPIAFELHRDGAKTTKGNFYGTDTTLLSENLKPATYYRFHALRFDKDKIADSSGTVEVRTMDTSAHAYTWEVQYIGDGQSSLYDVCAVNDTDVYAVGWIFMKDSTGNLDTDHPFNGIHWDGKSWELLKIPVEQCLNSGTFPDVLMTTGNYFEEKIFFGGQILTLKIKNKYNSECQLVGKQLGSLYKLWVKDEHRVFITGSKGWICLRDNGVYTNQVVPTTKNLTDIFGNKNEIWAVGGYPNKNEGVVVFNDRGTWTLKDSLSNNGTFSVRSVWVDELGYYNNGFLGLAGRGIRYFDVHWQEPPILLIGGNMGLGRLFFNSIRGTSRNNVFAVGHFGIVLHYNGNTWHFYPELFRYPESRYLTSCSVTEKSVFITGIQDDRGIIIRGRKNN